MAVIVAVAVAVAAIVIVAVIFMPMLVAAAASRRAGPVRLATRAAGASGRPFFVTRTQALRDTKP
ncbi:hypothetical protein VSR34_05440 [Paraburkholderia sp. JHI2823]|uniref:hypothetical protein n=1 Tax=Paraburkholderia TaxID=1822464 RepID=UPI001EE33EA3|nr:hypothetical protein [Paraburkholderia mimosarum]